MISSSLTFVRLRKKRFMKKTALLTITGLFPFVVFSQPLDLLNNFLNETKQELLHLGIDLQVNLFLLRE